MGGHPTTDDDLCDACKVGYHAPFERFDRLAVQPDGPAFLNRCRRCDALWCETLRAARRVSDSEAQILFPGATI